MSTPAIQRSILQKAGGTDVSQIAFLNRNTPSEIAHPACDMGIEYDTQSHNLCNNEASFVELLELRKFVDSCPHMLVAFLGIGLE